MKSFFGLGILGAAVVLASQACGSSDNSVKPRGDRPEGGAAGADSGADNSAGRDDTLTGGTGGMAGTVGESGATTAGSGGSSGATGEGGAAGNVNGGGQGGASEGGESGQGGTGGAGEGGTGGAGEEVTCEVAPTCSQDLSNVGTGDFSISFEITTNAQVNSAIVSQRQICMHSKFWEVALLANGAGISVETDDQVSYTSFVGPMKVNDGAPHEVRVCRKSGVIYVFADGTLRSQAASVTTLTTLPAFASKTTVCTSYGRTALVGALENVCVGPL
ncbi:MAG: hypothetical protein K0R38_7897 [Polyangiaceae bacterium]|nr:hypothetical protein [Polyangiaceae bacterium]